MGSERPSLIRVFQSGPHYIIQPSGVLSPESGVVVFAGYEGLVGEFVISPYMYGEHLHTALPRIRSRVNDHGG